MAKVVDPRTLPDSKLVIPGLKAPVWDFAPADDGDQSEVDAFIQMIRELRDGRYAAIEDLDVAPIR